MKKLFLTLLAVYTVLLSPQILVASNNYEWKLIFEDNFDINGEPDWTKWSYCKRNTANWKCYINPSSENVFVKDGLLTVKAFPNNDLSLDTAKYLTGGIETRGKFSVKYGKVEVKAKLSKGKGSWPAIWMMPEKAVYGWPSDGEIDIMEHLNFDDLFHASVHTKWANILQKEEPQRTATKKVNPTEFNVYGIEWDENKIDFLVNDELVFTYSKLNTLEAVEGRQWPFNENFFIILNQAAGGNWVGSINPEDMPFEMNVDWVRVYQKEPTIVLPSAQQMEWQKMETTAFIHFSINTYTDMEWGFGNESPSLFNPTNLDCEQWVRICKQAGMKGIILTAKHHDGFCLWPSKYTEHSVKNSPWKDGKGDLVKEFEEACRKHDMKFGLYLSPWDCNHAEYSEEGYIKYFHNQIKELLTNYGDLYEIWFDGAHGGRGYYGTDSLHKRSITNDYYRWEETIQLVKALQPNVIVHGGGKADIRWVGNEEGHAGEEHWSTIGEFAATPAVRFQLNKGHRHGKVFLPSETDVSIRPGWYYHTSEDHKIKSVSDMLNIYYESVGRNSLLLLNIPPDKRGLINEIDSAILVNWKKQYTKELSNPIQYKSIEKGEKTISINFGKKVEFNRVLLQEDIATAGQNVAKFTIEAKVGKTWVLIDSQTTIGYKRILRFPSIKTNEVRINILDQINTPVISNVEFFNAPIMLEAPTVRITKSDSLVLSSNIPNVKLYYKLGRDFEHYTKPVKISAPTKIEAKTVFGKNSSEIVTREHKISKANWTVLNDPKATEIIFDNENRTIWHSKGGENRFIEIDMTEDRHISGFKYTPDQSRYPVGIAINYKFYVSNDGKQWQVAAEGEFSNIINNPMEQDIKLTGIRKARYVKLEALQTSSNNLVVAEFDVY